jgi:hypothetical protein
LEKALIKMAHQLNALDESSLMTLWDKYAEITAHFEPSKRWEEAVLVFGFIQSIRFKNQLFNHHWSQGKSPGEPGPAGAPEPHFPAGHFQDDAQQPRAEVGPQNGAPETENGKKRGKLVQFRPKDEE